MDINDVENLNRQELIELVKRLLERIRALEAYVMEQDAEIQQLQQELGQKKPPYCPASTRSSLSLSIMSTYLQCASHRHHLYDAHYIPRTAEVATPPLAIPVEPAECCINWADQAVLEHTRVLHTVCYLQRPQSWESLALNHSQTVLR